MYVHVHPISINTNDYKIKKKKTTNHDTNNLIMTLPYNNIIARANP